jgi:hypothetical protein
VKYDLPVYDPFEDLSELEKKRNISGSWSSEEQSGRIRSPRYGEDSDSEPAPGVSMLNLGHSRRCRACSSSIHDDV